MKVQSPHWTGESLGEQALRCGTQSRAYPTCWGVGWGKGYTRPWAPTCLQRSSACFLSASACSARSMAFSLSNFSICIFFLMASMAAVGDGPAGGGADREKWAWLHGLGARWRVRRTKQDWYVPAAPVPKRRGGTGRSRGLGPSPTAAKTL